MSRQTAPVGRRRRTGARSLPGSNDGGDGDDLTALIVRPDQVCVTMSACYAAELLKMLRSSPKPPRGMCSQIFVDCPVEIVVDAERLEMLIDGLESAIGKTAAREA